MHIVPSRQDYRASDIAELMYTQIYKLHGIPEVIVSDRDSYFTSIFWSQLHKLIGVELRMSTSFHPQTDGTFERTNHTVIQAICYHVACNQKGWARALPHVRFSIMNTVNASTGFSPFQLHIGRSPRLIPPLFDDVIVDNEDTYPLDGKAAACLIEQIDTDVLEAQDNLLNAKLAQA